MLPPYSQRLLSKQVDVLYIFLQLCNPQQFCI
jgi:hypothetical protein